MADEKPYINQRMLTFMTKQEVTTVIVDRFDRDRFPELNKTIRTNFYSIDEQGFPIRRDYGDKKHIFGWKRRGNRFYHWATDDAMIDVFPIEKLRETTYQTIMNTWPTQCQEGGQFKKMHDIIQAYGMKV